MEALKQILTQLDAVLANPATMVLFTTTDRNYVTELRGRTERKITANMALFSQYAATARTDLDATLTNLSAKE
jgi:hypothetical protein